MISGRLFKGVISLGSMVYGECAPNFGYRNMWIKLRGYKKIKSFTNFVEN